MADITVVNGPLTLWWAAVGTSFPTIDGDPAAAGFTKIGSSGDKNYHEDGVVVMVDRTNEMFTPLGSTFPRKVFPTNDELVIAVTMVDLSLAQMRVALNQNTVTTNANDKEISLDRGVTPNTIALLVRGTGKSPEVDGDNVQFELYEVYERGSKEIPFVKGAGAAVLMEFIALENSVNGVGVLRAGT